MTEIFHNLMRNLVMLINARIALGNVNNFEKNKVFCIATEYRLRAFLNISTHPSQAALLSNRMEISSSSTFLKIARILIELLSIPLVESVLSNKSTFLSMLSCTNKHSL